MESSMIKCTYPEIDHESNDRPKYVHMQKNAYLTLLLTFLWTYLCPQSF